MTDEAIETAYRLLDDLAAHLRKIATEDSRVAAALLAVDLAVWEFEDSGVGLLPTAGGSESRGESHSAGNDPRSILDKAIQLLAPTDAGATDAMARTRAALHLTEARAALDG
jgi:hypothetical protein